MSEPIVYGQSSMGAGWMRAGRYHWITGAICVAFFFAMSDQAQKHAALDARGVDTTGTITALRVDVERGPKSSSGSRSKTYKYIGTFEFRDGAKATHRGEMFFSEHGYQAAKEGDPVQVRYLPDDPAVHRTHESLAEGTALAATVFGIAIALCAVGGLACFVKGYFVQLGQVGPGGAPAGAGPGWKRATAQVLGKKRSGYLVDRLKLKRMKLTLETVGLDFCGGEVKIERIVPAEMARTIEIGDEVTVVYPENWPEAACLADELDRETLERIADAEAGEA